MDEAASILYGHLTLSRPEAPAWKRYPVQFSCRTLNTMPRWFRGHQSPAGSIWSGGQYWAVNTDYCQVDELPREWRTWTDTDQEIGVSDAPTGGLSRLIHFGETPDDRQIHPCSISAPTPGATATGRDVNPRVMINYQDQQGHPRNQGHTLTTNCALAPLRAIEQLTAAEPDWRLLNDAALLAYHQQILVGVVICDRG